MSRSDDARALAEAGMQLDEDGRPVGFQVGKSAALSDWLFKKELKETETLINRARVRKWQMDVYDEGGERLDALRARKAAYAAKSEVKARANELARQRRRKAARRTRTCVECGKREELPFGHTGPVGKFCGDACRQRRRYRERQGPGTRHCSVCREVGHSKRTCPRRGESS